MLLSASTGGIRLRAARAMWRGTPRCPPVLICPPPGVWAVDLGVEVGRSGNHLAPRNKTLTPRSPLQRAAASVPGPQPPAQSSTLPTSRRCRPLRRWCAVDLIEALQVVGVHIDRLTGQADTPHTIGVGVGHHARAHFPRGHGVGAILVMAAGSVKLQPTRRIARTAVLSEVKKTLLSGSIVVPCLMAITTLCAEFRTRCHCR